MRRTSLIQTLSRLAAVIGLLAGLLLLVGTGTAAAAFEPPVILSPTALGGNVSNLPNCITVNWFHSGSGVVGFSVEREQPYWGRDDIGADQRSLPVCGMEPNTTYHFQVCAYFGTEDGDTECTEADLRTGAPETPPASQRPPAPRIVEHHAGETWIGIKWDAGYDYDSYFVNYTLKAAPGAPPNGPRTIHHDDDGTWGYQRVDGLLPGRTYIFQVQGCTETFFGLGEDHCWDWSATYEAGVPAYPLHSGPDTCAPGFVWREAFAGDHVCVIPARRDQVAADNAQANARRAYYSGPESGFVVPDTCKQGWVWREARPEDHVCVTPAERSLVAAENATANERRAVPR
ncbi:MAG: hypothetical protein AB7R89_31570 [Dehalococcoidia bacterium]